MPAPVPSPLDHPRTLGWIGTSALAMGGSNQMVFLIGALLANLTGVCYWWGWIPTCGFTAILSAAALHEWYVPWVPVTPLAVAIVAAFTVVNFLGVRTVTRVAVPIASAAALLALLSAVVPVAAG